MRALNDTELMAVAGGFQFPNPDRMGDQLYDQWSRYWIPGSLSADGQSVSGVTEEDSDGDGQYDTIVVTASASQVEQAWNQWYACFGLDKIIAAGLCFDNQDTFGYLGVGFGPYPLDVTFGYTADANSYLAGPAFGGNGLPGAAVSFDPITGEPTAIATQTGSPGISFTYGVNLSDLWNYFVNHGDAAFKTFADGLYDMADRPYDQPPVDKPPTP